jgi:hypothetical protein
VIEAAFSGKVFLAVVNFSEYILYIRITFISLNEYLCCSQKRLNLMPNQKQQTRHLSSIPTALIEVNAADNKNSAVTLQKRKEEAKQILYINRV